jgi:hypothetical protein
MELEIVFKLELHLVLDMVLGLGLKEKLELNLGWSCYWD